MAVEYEGAQGCRQFGAVVALGSCPAIDFVTYSNGGLRYCIQISEYPLEFGLYRAGSGYRLERKCNIVCGDGIEQVGRHKAAVASLGCVCGRATHRSVYRLPVGKHAAYAAAEVNTLVKMGIVVVYEAFVVTALGIVAEHVGGQARLGEFHVGAVAQVAGHNASNAVEGDNVDLLYPPERRFSGILHYRVGHLGGRVGRVTYRKGKGHPATVGGGLHGQLVAPHRHQCEGREQGYVTDILHHFLLKLYLS